MTPEDACFIISLYVDADGFSVVSLGRRIGSFSPRAIFKLRQNIHPRSLKDSLVWNLRMGMYRHIPWSWMMWPQQHQHEFINQVVGTAPPSILVSMWMITKYCSSFRMITKYCMYLFFFFFYGHFGMFPSVVIHMRLRLTRSFVHSTCSKSYLSGCRCCSTGEELSPSPCLFLI